jgi:DNA-binding NarL/FixJ family response regulator
LADAERMAEEIMDGRETSSRAIGGARDPGKGNHNAKLGLMKSPNLADRPEHADEKLRPSVALIDPKTLTRGPIGELLAKAFPEYALVAASSCEELLETEGIGRPNLVVVYIRSAGLTNTWVQSALELLRVRLPEASAVVLSDRDDVEEVNRALMQGVRGYIPTSVECEVTVAALRLIGAGGTFVPAGTLRSTAAKPDDQPENERHRRSDGLDLTPRELSVIDLLREGKPNKLIARQLDMQENTVKVHVRNILRKLNAANRTHAAFVANRLLGHHAKPVALPSPFPPIDHAQSPGPVVNGHKHRQVQGAKLAFQVRPTELGGSCGDG